MYDNEDKTISPMSDEELKNLGSVGDKEYYFFVSISSGFDGIARKSLERHLGSELKEIEKVTGGLRLKLPLKCIPKLMKSRCCDHVHLEVIKTEINWQEEMKEKSDIEQADRVQQIVKDLANNPNINWIEMLIALKISYHSTPTKIKILDDIDETDDTARQTVQKTQEPATKKQKLGIKQRMISNFVSTINWQELLELKDVTALKTPPNFRASCVRMGKHAFSSQSTLDPFGGAIQDITQWKVQLTKFDVEITLRIMNNQCYIVMRLTTTSMHIRNMNNRGSTTLRSTISNNLISFADPKQGEILVDPMCGAGSIPIEAAISYPNIQVYGGDVKSSNVNLSTKNKLGVEYSRCTKEERDNVSKIEFFQWNAKFLPLSVESVDVWICDVPFNKRCKSDNHYLYPYSLLDMSRCSKPLKTRAIILTADKRNMTYAIKYTEKYWYLSELVDVVIGGLRAYVYVLKRTEVKWENSKTYKSKQARKKKYICPHKQHESED